MPELPEVEVMVRGMRTAIVGQRIADFATRQPKTINMPPGQFRSIVCQPVVGATRRGKSAVMELETGAIWIHLGLNGQGVHLGPGVPDPAVPAAIVFTLDDGSRLRLERIFMGHAHYLSAEAQAERVAGLGLDPCTPAFDVGELALALREHGGMGLKALLMDQSVIGGIGNFCSDEVLHRAHLAPMRIGGSLSVDEVSALHASTIGLLDEAISAGGDESYCDLWGNRGRHTSRVHGRETCVTCGGPVTRVTLAGRGGYWCRHCQPA